MDKMDNTEAVAAVAEAMPTPGTFDLASVRIADDYQWMDVLHPLTGEPTGARILIAGAGTRTFQKVEADALSARIKQASKSKSARKMLQQFDADNLKSSEIDLLAGLTKNWEGLVLDGSQVPFTPEKARDMYNEFPWLLNQLKGFVNDLTNFIGN